MLEQEKAFQELLRYRNKLDQIEYEDIKLLLKNSIKSIPIATAKIKKGIPIDRVRLNKNTSFFTKQSELSYLKDQKLIDKVLNKYGRANKPYQPLFYGALESTKVRQNRVTALCETSDLIHDTKAECVDGELATLSRWIVQEEMIVSEIVFSDEALKVNPDTQASFENQFNQIMQHPNREFELKLIKFFSDEFAREVKNTEDYNYKISVAYAEIIMYDKKLAGITFPSVKSGFVGQNIVLRPDIVDSNLELSLASTHRFHKSKMGATFRNYFHTNKFGNKNENFEWDLNECNEAKLIEEAIKSITE